MRSSFEFTTSLQYENKHLKAQLAKYRSDEKYRELEKRYNREIRQRDSRIKQLEKEVAVLHRKLAATVDEWMAVNEDVEKEKERELKKKDTVINKLQKQLNDMARQRDEAKDKIRELLKELYAVKGELQDEQDKTAGLRAMMNKDHTNSSKPSSSNPNHKKVSNSREKTGKKAGGQPGHEHHARKKQKPTKTILVPPKKEHLDTSRYTPTGKTIKKQVIGLRILLDVTEYQTPEFRNIATGQRVHADFPNGLKDEATYDGTVKAAAYLLNHGCNVSIGNTRRIFSELTDGQLTLSTGLISKLQREFSEKTEQERADAFQKLMASPTMHVDYTFGRCNGKTSTVLICANEEVCLYLWRSKKGDEGVKGSPLEYYDGIVISDHESAFLHYGSGHQECLTHIQRYAQGSIENEPEKTWGTELKKWIQDAIHLRNETRKDTGVYDPGKVDELLARYDDIMEKAREEYESEPPTEYYREGYNLFRRMSEQKQDYVLFLHDITVEPTNNRAEQLARQYKRKNHQVITFRSTQGNSDYCDGLSILQNARKSEWNLYRTITEIFNKPRA